MPIVITPQGEYIDSVTGNPVNLPPQRPDFGSGSTSDKEMSFMNNLNNKLASGMRDSGSGSTSNREMSAMAGMMGQGGAISDEERRFLEETNRRMAPGMRPSGSGSTSDMEMRAYEDALRPTVGQGSVSDMEMDDVAKVQMLVDMGLSPADAMEAVAREKMSQVNPSAFGGNAESPNPGMGALSGVQAGNEIPMSMPTPRPEDLMMRQMPSGRDRTFNPNDPINRYNAPNT
jgi:hypothetical protein